MELMVSTESNCTLKEKASAFEEALQTSAKRR